MEGYALYKGSLSLAIMIPEERARSFEIRPTRNSGTQAVFAMILERIRSLH